MYSEFIQNVQDKILFDVVKCIDLILKKIFLVVKNYIKRFKLSDGNIKGRKGSVILNN